MNVYKSFTLSEVVFEELQGAFWDFDLINNTSSYSTSLKNLFEFDNLETPPSLIDLLYAYVAKEYLEGVMQVYNAHINSKGLLPFAVTALFKTKKNLQQLLFCKGKVIEWGFNNAPLRMVGCFFEAGEQFAETTNKKGYQIKNKAENFIQEGLSEHTNELAKIGGWEYFISEQKILWSKEVYEIYELPSSFSPTLDSIIEPYLPEYRVLLLEAIDNVVSAKAGFDLELMLTAASGNNRWVRVIGRPILNELKQVIGLRGAMQDINDRKLKEIAQQQSIEIINDQNKRLRNFAHIVSHNLRSHAGNMNSILSLLKMTDDEKEKRLFVDNLEKISKSLNQTISHLGEVVRIQVDVNKVKKPIGFQDVFNNTLYILRPNIEETQAIVTADFSACPIVEYVPAYLESIMLNLISNAIKYMHPERNPIIHVSSKKNNGITELSVQDNGIGIDLAKHKDKLFGMYKTFHQHPDARGIGLFITKNQIEALGGNISVTSQVGKGTTFKIQF